MLDEMLDFYSHLRKHKKDSKFLFLSREPKENIVSIAREKDIPEDEVIVVGTKHNEVPLYVSVFDYSIFFIRPTFSKKASSPTKQGELMAMGVPIRSEERRVGKECRSRWWRCHEKRKK